VADVIALRDEAFTKTGGSQVDCQRNLFLFVKENNLIEGDKRRLTTTTFVDCNEATADVEHFSSDVEPLTKY
jgi:hypothetical protein